MAAQVAVVVVSVESATSAVPSSRASRPGRFANGDSAHHQRLDRTPHSLALAASEVIAVDDDLHRCPSTTGVLQRACNIWVVECVEEALHTIAVAGGGDLA